MIDAQLSAGLALGKGPVNQEAILIKWSTLIPSKMQRGTDLLTYNITQVRDGQITATAALERPYLTGPQQSVIQTVGDLVVVPGGSVGKHKTIVIAGTGVWTTEWSGR